MDSGEEKDGYRDIADECLRDNPLTPFFKGEFASPISNGNVPNTDFVSSWLIDSPGHPWLGPLTV